MSEPQAQTTDQKMDPELKAKWLEALRSGKYGQGTQQLRFGDAFCCLGVLCDVVDPNAWDDEEWFHGDGEDRDSEIGVLPFRFREFIARIPDPVETELVNMNDNGKSFAEIADWIEANL